MQCAHLVGGRQATGVRHGAALTAGVVLRTVEVHVQGPVLVGNPSTAAELQQSPPQRLRVARPHTAATRRILRAARGVWKAPTCKFSLCLEITLKHEIEFLSGLPVRKFSFLISNLF